MSDSSARSGPGVTDTAADDPASIGRAIAAGVGFAIVVLTYGPSRFEDADRYWAAGAAVLVAVLLADALVDVRAMLPTPGVAPLTIVAALVAIALCVPETDQIVIAALLPGVVVALEVVQRRQVGIEWYAVAAASVGWAGMFGATGRQSALVGALFAWWPVILPAAMRIIRPIPTVTHALLVAAVGAVAAVVMARTGGTTDSWTTVAIAGFGCVAVSIGLSLAILSRTITPAGESSSP